MNLSICRLGGFMKKLVVFGFDGTLADTAPGILYCFNTTAVAMGYEPVEHSALYGVIGTPLEYGFKTLFNMSDDEIEYAVKNYSKLYSQKGKEMFTVYDGIYDALRELKKSGFKLAIATQKHRMFTTDILETCFSTGTGILRPCLSTSTILSPCARRAFVSASRSEPNCAKL